MRVFIPSILFCGVGSAETFSNFGIMACVRTGWGNSLRYNLRTLATTAGSKSEIRGLPPLLNAAFSLFTLDLTPDER